MGKQKFTVTEDHLKLLGRAYVTWDDCEFGAPGINCKRPYGNSSVYSDIAEILDIKPEGEDGDFTAQQEQLMNSLHRETQTVLQIILVTGVMIAGDYEADKYDTNWRCC